ncbi:MAG: hypothetical protein ACO1N0_17110 [Fluviicola sp.]
MNKVYPIHWTNKADVSYFETILFILEKWTIKEAEYFEKLTEELLLNLATNHQLCPEIKKLNLRKCAVSPQTSLVYRIKGKSIELISFVDNRSDHDYKSVKE